MSYVAVKLSEESIKDLEKLCEDNNLAKPSDLHVTIISSKNKLENFPLKNYELKVQPEFFQMFGNDLVLRFESDILQNRFNELISLGATPEFDEYLPHVTINYDYNSNVNFLKLPIPSSITLTEEYHEDLVEDWRPWKNETQI